MAVRLLGEDLTLFRAADGQVGLIGDRCPHRLTEMKYGIPDNGGLRCCYHGWMFDPAGRCVDTPLESAGDGFRDNIRIKGYPARGNGRAGVGVFGAAAGAAAAAVGFVRAAQRHPADRGDASGLQLAAMPRKHRRPGA